MRDTTKAREAAAAVYRRRRADKAKAELLAQGYTVIEPDQENTEDTTR